MDAREIPLLLCSIFTALLETLGVFREALFMLFLFRGTFGVTASRGSWSAMAPASAAGEGVLMRDTEKRPCTVGVWTPESKGVLAGVTPTREAGLEIPREDLLLTMGVTLEAV